MRSLIALALLGGILLPFASTPAAAGDTAARDAVVARIIASVQADDHHLRRR